MNAYTFNSRETYLVAVAQWKEDYKAASQANREARKELKEANRLASKEQTTANWAALNRAVVNRQGHKAEARHLLDIRQKMKVEAQSQYLAQKQAKTAQV